MGSQRCDTGTFLARIDAPFDVFLVSAGHPPLLRVGSQPTYDFRNRSQLDTLRAILTCHAACAVLKSLWPQLNPRRQYPGEVLYPHR